LQHIVFNFVNRNWNGDVEIWSCSCSASFCLRCKNLVFTYAGFSLHTDTTPPQPNHNVTPTHIEPEQYNSWNNSTHKSQTLEDGCINIRNMLSIKKRNNKASDIKLVSLYSTNISCVRYRLDVVWENNHFLLWDFFSNSNKPVTNTGYISCVERDQLDVTCFIISLFNAQHVSDVNTSNLKSLRLMC